MRKHLVVGAILLLAGTGTALAYHPTPREMGRVRALAHDLERIAERAHRLAERQRHHFDRREESALRALHRLADESRHFHRQAERFFQNPVHTARDFRDVAGAWVRTARRLDHLHGAFVVEREIHRIGRLVLEIDRYYGVLDHHRMRRHHYRGRYWHRPGHHDRFDRGPEPPGHQCRGRGHRRGRGFGHRKGRGHGHWRHGDRRWRRAPHRYGTQDAERQRDRDEDDRRRFRDRDWDDPRYRSSRHRERDRDPADDRDRRRARDTRPD
ncbi:MAG: hypothetical protein R3234_11745 [Thermoanaerobaculia bacterium]|nr:hypothetical protein [Thermoanaerobaculia bacterium]